MSKVMLSELLEKLYSGDYLSDDEYKTYLQLLKIAKEKELNENSRKSTTKNKVQFLGINGF